MDFEGRSSINIGRFRKKRNFYFYTLLLYFSTAFFILISLESQIIELYGSSASFDTFKNIHDDGRCHIWSNYENYKI